MKPATALAFLFVAPARAETVSPLFARGYVVMPQPQMVRLGASDFAFPADWRVELQGVASGDAAIEVLNEELAKRFHVKLTGSGRRRHAAPGHSPELREGRRGAGSRPRVWPAGLQDRPEPRSRDDRRKRAGRPVLRRGDVRAIAEAARRHALLPRRPDRRLARPADAPDLLG